MPQAKPTGKVVKVEQPEITQPNQSEPPPITITINDPGAIAYAVVSGVVGAVLDRLFGVQNHD